MEFIQQLVPKISRFGVLWNPATPSTRPEFDEMQNVAARLNLAIDPVMRAGRGDERAAAFGTISRGRTQALVVISDRLLLAHRGRIVTFVAEHRLPAMYPYREYVDAGGLLSYALSNITLFREAAIYVDKMLKGRLGAEARKLRGLVPLGLTSLALMHIAIRLA